MSRLSAIAIAALFALALVPNAAGQEYYELGVMSGTGGLMMPTSLMAPNAQFRLDVSRFGMLGRAGRGFNLITIDAGLSRNVEGYLRYTSEQSGQLQSTTAVDFGGKFTLPILFPLVRLVSLWGEFSTSQSGDRSVLLPPSSARMGVILTPSTNGLRPSILVGTTKLGDGEQTWLAGGCLVYSPSHSVQFSGEYLYGYAGIRTSDAAVNANIRIVTGVCLHVGPGYTERDGYRGWLWTAGVSLNTSDVDFHPIIKAERKEYKLPTIEEMEKSPSESTSDSEQHNDPIAEDHQ